MCLMVSQKNFLRLVISNETIYGYSIRIVQKIGNMIVQKCIELSLPNYSGSNSNFDCRIIAERQTSRLYIDAKNEFQDPRSLFDAFDIHKDSGDGKLILGDETYLIPRVDTVQNFVDVFSKYQDVDL